MLKRQQGSFLIEALIGVLLFMGGILALMGVAATAINQVTQTKFRNDASNLASEIVGQMYSEWDGVSTTYNHSAWDARVQSALPGGNVDWFKIQGKQVDIKLSWKDKGATHIYMTTAVINK